MRKLIILSILILILVAILATQRETFMIPNKGLETQELHPAQYSNNYINEFSHATVSPKERIAVLRHHAPSPNLTKCQASDCPSPLKEKGFDCFKCSL